MEITSSCQTGRESASLHIQVSWFGKRAEHFDEAARTITISRHGATLMMPQKLIPTQEITVRRPETGNFATARVVGFIGQKDGWNIYGVAFIDSTLNFWDTELPAAEEPETAKAPLFLECASCLTRAWIDLDEIQTEVFEARRLITLSCKQCALWTVWGLASHDSSPRPDSNKDSVESSPASAQRSINERKHGRVLTRMNACVRHAGITEEIVRVKDASRGGFRFVSPNFHPDGAHITVAIPYTPNASNVFVSARIIWRKEVRHMERYEYGATYTSPPESARKRLRGNK